MRRCSRLPALLVVLAAVAGCANPAAAPSGGGSAGEALPEIVAEAGSIKITGQEMTRAMAAQEYQQRQQMYQQRQEWIQNEIVERMLAKEAAKEGLDVEGLLKKVDGEAKIVSDTDAQMFYKVQAQQGRIKDPQTGKVPAFEELKDRIKQHLTEQSKQANRQQYFAKVMAGNEPKINLALPEPPQIADVSPETDPFQGPEDAKVTVVEFSDFQCPACKQAHFKLGEVLDKYKDKIKFVYRDFPLTGKHPDALPASVAAHCAGDQGKYWEMHDLLFKAPSLKENDFKTYATKLSLDAEKFGACLKDPAKDAEVRKDLDDGRAYGVNSTPTFYVNGYLVVGANVAELSRLIDRELEKAGAGS